MDTHTDTRQCKKKTFNLILSTKLYKFEFFSNFFYFSFKCLCTIGELVKIAGMNKGHKWRSQKVAVKIIENSNDLVRRRDTHLKLFFRTLFPDCNVVNECLMSIVVSHKFIILYLFCLIIIISRIYCFLFSFVFVHIDWFEWTVPQRSFS